MPWAHANLRGQRVLVRVRADGSFDATGGRVEIRYKASDPRAYRASVSNLALLLDAPVLPESAVVKGEEVAPKESKEQRSATRKAEAAKRATAPGAVPKDAWTVYVDGACSGNPGPAGLGIVIVSPTGEQSEGFEYLGSATNNVAELTAILRATELVPSGEKAVVHTDSQYSIGVLTKGWKAKANQELVAALKHAWSGRGRGWNLVYVPGHSGVELNERADRLAVAAVAARSSKMPRRGSAPARSPSAASVPPCGEPDFEDLT